MNQNQATHAGQSVLRIILPLGIMRAADDDVVMLGPNIALVAEQGYGLGVDLDLGRLETALDEGGHRRIRVAKLRLKCNKVGHASPSGGIGQ
ncbi:MAG: hypothetical protein ACYSVY_10215 [Planctomycetota bacterium]